MGSSPAHNYVCSVSVQPPLLYSNAMQANKLKFQELNLDFVCYNESWVAKVFSLWRHGGVGSGGQTSVQQLKVSQAVWSSIFMGCESVYRTNFKTDFLLSEILQPQVNYKPQVFTVEGAVMGSWCSLHTFLGVASSWVRSHSGEINHWWATFTSTTPCPVHDRWGDPNLLVIWS